MPRRYDRDELRQVAAIRHLQYIAAEAKAARSASALRKKDEVRKESERARGAVEESWLDSLSAPSLQVEMSRLWSAELLVSERTVRRAMAEAHAESAELARRVAGLHAAATRRDSAQEIVRKAAKARARRREEIALQDASDRHAQRWSGR